MCWWYAHRTAALDPPAVKAIGDEGYNVLLWTVDSLDWWGLSKEEVIETSFQEWRTALSYFNTPQAGRMRILPAQWTHFLR